MIARIDTAAINRATPLPDLVGAITKLQRVGSEYRCCCPLHSDRSPSFYIFADGLAWHCFGCGKGGDAIRFVQELHKVDFRSAAQMLVAGDLPKTEIAPIVSDDRDKTAKIEKARSIWRAAVPAAGTLAETYLRSRAIDIRVPETIRFAELPYGRTGRNYPCLVAAIAGPDNRFSGIQRTYLNDNGTGKANVPDAKLSLGKISGGAIRLAPSARRMIVCEGLEDGLSLQQELGGAVWVAAGAGNMPKMQFPPSVQFVQVGGDADASGRDAATKAVAAFEARGLTSRPIFPVGAKDFNAELMGAGR
jgi:DNA primase